MVRKQQNSSKEAKNINEGENIPAQVISKRRLNTVSKLNRKFTRYEILSPSITIVVKFRQKINTTSSRIIKDQIQNDI